jgi:D-glycero-alpha-D-manno-heptose 1-phosphate guanylyltransferase
VWRESGRNPRFGGPSRVSHQGVDSKVGVCRSVKNTDVSDLPALILAGGLGTRLRPAFDAGPKGLAPVGGRPFLQYLLQQIYRAGFYNVVLCVGYGRRLIEEAIGDGARWGLRVRYSVETQPLGTAGAVKRAGSLIDKEDFLVFNGDSFLGVDLKQLVEEHLSFEAWATMALARVDDATRFGSVVLAPDGQIKEFREKSSFVMDNFLDTQIINGGIYVLSKRVLDMIPECGVVSLEREVFPLLLTRGVRGFLCDGYFIDIGLPDDFERAQAELPKHF